jgi:hypothetical protein
MKKDGGGKSTGKEAKRVPLQLEDEYEYEFEKENMDANLDFLSSAIPRDGSAPHRYPPSVSLLSPINSP